MSTPILATTVPAERAWSRLSDAVILLGALALFYAILVIGHTWLGPLKPATEISLSPTALPKYAAYSLLRMAMAYIVSLLFAITYGYMAATSAKAERILIPLLDVLQSIPVLSFLPPVMLAMVALFPGKEIGVELGSILLIFTGQAWNMAFSFYSSMKSIPAELREAASMYRFPWWQRFSQLELPYAAIGLVWNSMMSVAGGWFFLMACEMFVLGSRDLRLPGLGSYLQTAASAGDTTAILWGVGTMIGIIVVIDQLVWRPAIAASDKFKFEQVESRDVPRSAVLDFLRRSHALQWGKRRITTPVGELLAIRFARHARDRAILRTSSAARLWLGRLLAVAVLLVIAYGAARAIGLMLGLTAPEAASLFRAALTTFLRVNVALIIGALWTIPVGVAIGFNPRLARVAQPLAQIAASVPATALFPVILLILVGVGRGLGVASVVLMLLGTQWYILFNVIAGAMAIPSDLKEAAGIFRFGVVQRWRLLILPGIFPYLVTGMLTATGGAWNASIVAEYFHFKDQVLSTTGLGATISLATDQGNFHLLLVSTVVMIAMVITMNRLVWKRLYRLAGTRFRLDT
jgi:NitT/TauT family transport system permease protein